MNILKFLIFFPRIFFCFILQRQPCNSTFCKNNYYDQLFSLNITNPLNSSVKITLPFFFEEGVNFVNLKKICPIKNCEISSLKNLEKEKRKILNINGFGESEYLEKSMSVFPRRAEKYKINVNLNENPDLDGAIFINEFKNNFKFACLKLGSKKKANLNLTKHINNKADIIWYNKKILSIGLGLTDEKLNNSRNISFLHINTNSEIVWNLNSETIRIPAHYFEKILSFLNSYPSNASCFQNLKGKWFCKKLKIFHFRNLRIMIDFQNSSHLFNIRPDAIFKKCKKKKEIFFSCQFMLQSAEKHSSFILGQPAYQGKQIFFDVDEKKIGIRKTKNKKNAEQTIDGKDYSKNYLYFIPLFLLLFIILYKPFIGNRMRNWLVQNFRKKKTRIPSDDNDVREIVKHFDKI